MSEIADFNTIISYLVAPPLPGTLLVLKGLFIAIFLFFLIAIIYILSKSNYLKLLWGKDVGELFAETPYVAKKITKIWDKVVKRLESKSESDSKLALIEADGILDGVLKRIGYDGETLGDRLKQLTSAHLSNLDDVWKAHKIRNNIVHDPSYRLSLDEAKESLAIYEKALQDLEAF